MAERITRNDSTPDLRREWAEIDAAAARAPRTAQESKSVPNAPTPDPHALAREALKILDSARDETPLLLPDRPWFGDLTVGMVRALARAVLDTERRTIQDTASEDLERRYRANLLWLEQHRHSLMVTADGRWWVPDWAPADNPYDAIENARLDVSMETPHA